MQTMTALLRVAGDRNMTVRVQGVTPGEALLLMQIHDPSTKDVFESAVLTGDVERSSVEERDRLYGRYPEARKLTEQLFPGRNASDIPDAFDDLQDVPLEVAATAPEKKAPPAKKGKASKTLGADAPLSSKEAMNLILHGDAKG